jgi:hypothetical protein
MGFFAKKEKIKEIEKEPLPPQEWKLRHTLTLNYTYEEDKKGLVVFYLEEDSENKRRFTRKAFGACLMYGNYNVDPKIEAELELWIRAGIPPEKAENIMLKKLSQA